MEKAGERRRRFYKFTKDGKKTLAAQRAQEIGVRLALGAQPRNVLRLVIG